MHAHKNSMHSLPYRTNRGKMVERAVHGTTLFYKVNRPLLHYQRQRNKNDNKFKWLAWFSFFPTIFPAPEKKKKKKETVCKRIFRRTHKVQQKKKKKKKFHERFSLTKISIISFISKYLFFADYHKIAQTDLITSTLSVSYRTGSSTQYMSSTSLLLSIDWWFEQKGSLINNLLLILYPAGVVQEISIIMVYTIHRWLMNAWRYTDAHLPYRAWMRFEFFPCLHSLSWFQSIFTTRKQLGRILKFYIKILSYPVVLMNPSHLPQGSPHCSVIV